MRVEAWVICEFKMPVGVSEANGLLRAIQYAKAMDLRVLAIDGGPEKAALCVKLGADAVVDFTKAEVRLYICIPELRSIFLTHCQIGCCGQDH